MNSTNYSGLYQSLYLLLGDLIVFLEHRNLNLKPSHKLFIFYLYSDFNQSIKSVNYKEIEDSTSKDDLSYLEDRHEHLKVSTSLPELKTPRLSPSHSSGFLSIEGGTEQTPESFFPKSEFDRRAGDTGKTG